jgi:hypothetical protein
MTRLIRTLALVAWSVLLLSATAAAQAPASGFGLRYAIPYEALADTHKRGYGVTWTSWASSGGAWSSLGVGWTRFPGKDPATDGDPEIPDLNQAEVLLGFGLTVSGLEIGARGGYFFRDEDEWDLLPTVSLRLGTMVLTAEAKVLGDVRWYGASVQWRSDR